MGKSEDKKISKSEKKKKKKDKDNEYTMKSPKKVYYNTSDGKEDFQLTEKEKKKLHKMNKTSDLIESPKKRFSVIEEPAPILSPKKKSKKSKEVAEEEPTLKMKSISRDLDLDVSPRKKLSEFSPSKKSKRNSLTLRPDMNSDRDSDHSDKEELKSATKGANLVSTEPDIITSDKHIEDAIGWSKDDLVTLLENITKSIPDKDNLKYTSRIERLDWTLIKFNNHSAEECKEKWKIVEKKVRGFRILREMVLDAKLWVEKPWSSFYKSHKKNRHPDMPRRPLTSYMLFYMAKKSKFSKKHPNLGLTELSKIIADKFHKLSYSKKEKYVEQARVLREEYNEKMQKFLDTHPNESIALKKKLKEDKMQMPGPKRPLSPMKLFLEEKMKQFEAENEDLSKAACLSKAKELWKHLSTKKKVPWIRWAHENEKKYLEELEIYKSENPNFEMPKIKPLLSKEEVTILERMEGKPEKPPNSAYSLFSRLLLKDDQIKLMKFSPKERMREISRLWAAVSEKEKKQYQDKAKHLLEIYKLEYATYLESLPEDKRAEELAKSQSRKRKKKSDSVDEGGKKLKQTKIEDSFKAKADKKVKEEIIIKSLSSDSEEDEKQQKDDDSEDEVEDQDSDEDEDDIFKNPQKLKEIREKIEALDPPKPNLGAFELFKEIYLTNPGNKESKAKMIWDSMPKKEKERYNKKLEAQKQNYILQYKDFLAKLKPHEIKVYSMMKNQLTHLSDSSGGEESDDETSSSSSDEEDRSQVQSTTAHKTEENSSTSSEESD